MEKYNFENIIDVGVVALFEKMLSEVACVGATSGCDGHMPRSPRG